MPPESGHVIDQIQNSVFTVIPGIPRADPINAPVQLGNLWLGALHSFSDALFYSVDSKTTRVASEIAPEQQLRMLGALKAADGMLLFGISTAYIFALMHIYWPMLDGSSGNPVA